MKSFSDSIVASQMMECLFGIGVRLLVTCPDQLLREEVIHRFTGGTTLLTGQYELGLDQRKNPDETPDNRYGAILHIWVPWAEAKTPFQGRTTPTPREYIENILEFCDFKALGAEETCNEKKMILISALKKRLRDALLPIPSVSIYTAAKRKSEESKIDLGPFCKSLSLAPIFEGDQESSRNIKNKSVGTSYNILLLGGLIKIEDQFIEIGVCGATFFISGPTLEQGLKAGRQALQIIETLPEVCHIFDVCGSGVIPNKKNKKQQTDLIAQHPELAMNPSELVVKSFSLKTIEPISLSIGAPTLEIIMNSFSLKRLVECIKTIQISINKSQSEISLRPAWYDWQWGNIALGIDP